MLLHFRVSMSDERPGFAQAEIQLAEKPLALAHPQIYLKSLTDEGRQGLAIPEMSCQPVNLWRLSQCSTNFRELGLVE
jgi:hypothetical protein